MELFKFSFKYWKKYLPFATLAQLISFVAITADLLLPLLAGMLLNYIIKGETIREGDGGVFAFVLDGTHGKVQTFELFFYIAAVYLTLVLVRIILVYAKNTINQFLGLNLETDLRVDTFHKLMELDSQTISEYNSGELLQTINSDTIMYKELFCRMIPNICDSVFVLVITVYLLSTIDIRFIWIPIVMMPILLVALFNFRKRAKKNFTNIRANDSRMNLTVQENIEAVRLVRSFTNERLERDKFHESNMNFRNARLKQLWLSSKFDLKFNTIKQVAYIGTIIIGAVLVMNGQMTAGNLLAASTYVVRIMNYITGLNNQIFAMQQEMIAGLELKHFMEKTSKVPDNKEPNLRSDTPNIELKDVCLELDGQQILKDINQNIDYLNDVRGGKSVLLKTLVRIKDITSGSITIDGHDIKEFGLTNLRNMYSYVFQDVFLFSNTIESNIAFSRPDVNPRSVAQAAAHAQASKFIDVLPQRYKTIVGERGLGISGGQKQRVSIARAFHKNAPIFVLDDSTSALDVNTERVLLKDINDNFSYKTVIITAHRFSSVVNCDEIIYLKDGEITERGTFEELMKLDGNFAHIYKVQQAQHADSLAEKATAGHGGEING